MKNPYQVLGVKESATQNEIKKAYRTLAKKYHPDLNPGNKQNEIKFKEISHAYDQIGTPEARAKYDRGETEDLFGQQAGGGGGHRHSSFYHGQQNTGRYSHSFADQFGDEDFFEQLFKGAGGRFHQARKPENEDVHYKMDISFRDSILGTEKVITLANGKSLQVKIPPGINDGAKLRFKGQGQHDIADTPAGDAYIEVSVQPETGWERKGLDIEMELPISFIEAILGADVSVPTLHGPVMLKIPPGVNTGTKLRIKGKGVQQKNESGNQIVRLKVLLPKHPDPELQKTIKDWEGKFDYNPRGDVH